MKYLSLLSPIVVSVGFATASYTAQEGQRLDVAVVKDAATPFSIIVSTVVLMGGTAEADKDYIIAIPLEVVIPPNNTTLLLPLAISYDEEKEDTEKFSLSLVLPGGQRNVMLGPQSTTEIDIEDVEIGGDPLTDTA